MKMSLFLPTKKGEEPKKNSAQHTEFLAQFGEGSPEYRDSIDWFRRLPVWLELPGLRVVHACWHDATRAVLRPYLNSKNCFTEGGLWDALQGESEAYLAAEILLKGPEERLPPGVFFLDKDGHKREEVRIRWWDANATTFRKAALGMDNRLEELPNSELLTDYRYRETTPVLFGHYWMTDAPTLTASNAVCLDFSVAKAGYLTAYRWSGERELLFENLVYVSAQDSDA